MHGCKNFMFRYCCTRTAKAKEKVDKVFEISSLSVKTSPQRRNCATIWCYSELKEEHLGNQTRARTSSHDRLKVRKLSSCGGIGCGGAAIEAPPRLQFEYTPSATTNLGAGARFGELANKLKSECLPTPVAFFDPGLELLQPTP